MTPEQKEILQLLHQNGGTLTKKQVVDSLDGYFCNGEKHLGDRLSRMVNAGLLKRVRPGVFEVGSGKKAKQVDPVIIDENQTTLFE